jgi:pimeloyl-ACP methyl ester carboxylesterase
MKSALRKIARVRFLLREAYFLPRAEADRQIHRALSLAAEERRGRRQGFQAYLSDHPPVSDIRITKDWHDGGDGEMRLEYTNSLFAPGFLRLRRDTGDAGILICLPGFHTTASQILVERGHQHYLGQLAAANRFGLAAWNWPLQGSRLEACLYHGLGSIYSAEREYSRVLPALGTSLWREFVAEFAFALREIHRLVGGAVPLYVMGWSMGGSFAFAAPLLGVPIKRSIAAGSCAALVDLFQEHQARIHGYFFYPHDALDYFDLDDIVSDVVDAGTRLLIIHGDQDPGCLSATRKRLQDGGAIKGDGSVRLHVLENHGHVLSDAVIHNCVEFLQQKT